MRKLLLVTVVTTFFFISANSQESFKKDNEKYLRASEIIKSAQEAVYKGIKKEEIKSIYLNFSALIENNSLTKIGKDETPKEVQINQSLEDKYSVVFDNKVNHTSFAFDPKKNSIDNYTKLETILNGDRFSTNSEIIIDGKKLDNNALFNSSIFSESMKKQMKEMQEKMKPTKESILQQIHNALFPIFINTEWINDKRFAYIGKADSGTQKANILELETDTDRKTRYFFDEQTNLLLMITDEVAKQGKSVKTATYFTDYQLIEGVMVAKKINTQTETAVDNIEMEVLGKKFQVSSSSKIISESTLKELKINPFFKAETFEIREGKQ